MAIEIAGQLSANASTRNKVSNSASNNHNSDAAVVKNPAATSTQPQPETVKLSDQAQTLSKLEESVAQLPDIDEGRIASIKQAIDDGSYAIDPERIAAKLTSLEDRLFG